MNIMYEFSKRNLLFCGVFDIKDIDILLVCIVISATFHTSESQAISMGSVIKNAPKLTNC